MAKYIFIRPNIFNNKLFSIFFFDQDFILGGMMPGYKTPNSYRDAVRKMKKRFVVKKVTHDIKCQTACGNDYSSFVNEKVYEMISIKDKNVESN